MEREIKFRGKRLDNGQWVYGYLVRSEATVDGNYAVCQIHVPFALAASVEVVDVDPQTVGQFTGLYLYFRDHQPLFEGDLLKNPKGEVGEVIWQAGGFVLKSEPKRDGARIFIALTEGFLFNKTIIGDIHNNPDLFN